MNMTNHYNLLFRCTWTTIIIYCLDVHEQPDNEWGLRGESEGSHQVLILTNFLMLFVCWWLFRPYRSSFIPDTRSLVGEKKLHLGEWSETKAVFLQPGLKNEKHLQVCKIKRDTNMGRSKDTNRCNQVARTWSTSSLQSLRTESSCWTSRNTSGWLLASSVAVSAFSPFSLLFSSAGDTTRCVQHFFKGFEIWYCQWAGVEPLLRQWEILQPESGNRSWIARYGRMGTRHGGW